MSLSNWYICMCYCMQGPTWMHWQLQLLIQQAMQILMQIDVWHPDLWY